MVEFNLHANGRITGMKLLSSDVDELQSLICQQAVLDPAPFKPWPQKMRQVIPDPRQVRFTFYYPNNPLNSAGLNMENIIYGLLVLTSVIGLTDHY